MCASPHDGIDTYLLFKRRMDDCRAKGVSSAKVSTADESTADGAMEATVGKSSTGSALPWHASRPESLRSSSSKSRERAALWPKRAGVGDLFIHRLGIALPTEQGFVSLSHHHHASRAKSQLPVVVLLLMLLPLPGSWQAVHLHRVGSTIMYRLDTHARGLLQFDLCRIGTSTSRLELGVAGAKSWGLNVVTRAWSQRHSRVHALPCLGVGGYHAR